MTLNIKLKRSAVLGSTPTASQLEDGELGINYNVDDPALYLKDSSGAVVRIAGDNASGTYWDRSGTTLNTRNSGDDVEIDGVFTSNSKLVVDGTDNSVVSHFYGASGSTNRGLEISLNTRNTTDNALVRLDAKHSSNGSMALATRGTDRVYIDGGNVLIGGTLPTSPNTAINADGTASFGSNVGVGTDNPLSRFHISGGFNSHIRQTNTSDDALDHYGDANRSSSDQRILSTKAMWSGTEVAAIDFLTGADAVNKDNGSIAFRTAATSGNLVTRATISENGIAAFKSNTGLQAEFGLTNGDYRNGENYTRIYGSNATHYVQTKACVTADNTAAFDITIGSSQQAVIRADGDMENANGTYGQLSDERLKENIEDAPSQWEDVKETKVRSFNFKEATGYSTHKQIGWVAQEVELVSPGCVSETEPEEGEEPKKSVKSSVMLIKAYKALQEAMERIETLEERLASLESNASA